MKSVLVFHSYSAFGQMGINILLPILKTGGLQPTYLPTTLLSTHTAYSNPVIKAQDEFVLQTLQHFDDLSLEFEVMVSGYCFSVDLIYQIANYFEQHPKPFKVVDPVLGDRGQLYSGLTVDHVEAFRQLIQKADLVTPNVTEAYLLADLPYPAEDRLTMEDLQMLTKRLSALTSGIVVVKGVVLEQDFLTNVIIKDQQILNQFSHRLRPQHYFGSGDLFASLLTVHLMNEVDLEAAVKRSGELILDAIDASLADPANLQKGIEIHSILPSIYFISKQQKR